jgi:hypothetical protein
LGFDRLRALLLLTECTGDDIWSPEHCHARGVPESWMEELTDCFESGFLHDSQTIYVGRQATNQYLGIRDVDLAVRLGAFLGVDVDQLQACSATRRELVRNIQQAVEED